MVKYADLFYKPTEMRPTDKHVCGVKCSSKAANIGKVANMQQYQDT